MCVHAFANEVSCYEMECLVLHLTLFSLFSLFFLNNLIYFQFVEKQADGGSVVRTQRVNDVMASRYDRDRQRLVEKKMDELRREFEKRQSMTSPTESL